MHIANHCDASFASFCLLRHGLPYQDMNRCMVRGAKPNMLTVGPIKSAIKLHRQRNDMVGMGEGLEAPTNLANFALRWGK